MPCVRSADGKEEVKDTGKGKGPDGWKQLQTRPPTKFERDAMEAAQTRHKDSIGRPKVWPRAEQELQNKCRSCVT